MEPGLDLRGGISEEDYRYYETKSTVGLENQWKGVQDGDIGTYLPLHYKAAQFGGNDQRPLFNERVLACRLRHYA